MRLFVIACSGPGAAEAIGNAELIGLGCVLVALIAACVTAYRARKLKHRQLAVGALVAFPMLGLFFPVIGMVRMGDCGATSRLVSLVLAAGYVGLAALSLTLKKPVEK